MARRAVEYQAAEAFPLEVGGFLAGFDSHVLAAVAITKYRCRSQTGLEAYGESTARAEEVFGDAILGEFHSHPNTPAALSKHDMDYMDDDDIE